MKIVLTVLLLTACASASTPSEDATGKASQSVTTTSAALEGTYGFALAQSDVAAPLKERCKGDAACWTEIENEAKTEKIRFTKGENGQMVWRSFGEKEGKEELFLELPITLAPDGPKAFIGSVAGPAKGMQAAKSEQMPKTMRIEIVDEKTIAMNDPKKGRLVFVKE